MEKIPLLNANYCNVTADELLDAVCADAKNHARSMVVFMNADVVMKVEADPELRAVTDQAEYIVADGKPLIWISKLYNTPIKAKVSGSDFVPALCARAAREGLSVFLAGGREEVLAAAAANLKRDNPALVIAGTYSPPMGFEKNPEELQKMVGIIRDAHPDIFVLCLGCPKQEKFIARFREEYDAGVSVCAGATVDFLAGNVKRAPRWMSEHGLEWFYRFLQEPARLFRRYFIDDMKIFPLAWKYRGQKK